MMKRFIHCLLASIALCAILSIAGCDERSEVGASAATASVPDSATAPPRLALDHKELSLKEEETLKSIVERVVEVTNRGGSELLIDRISVSCNCTSAQAEKNHLAPGESTTIAVSVRPLATSSGSASIDFHSNDPASPVTRLSIAWDASKSLRINPALHDLGVLTPGETRRIPLTVERITDEPAESEPDVPTAWSVMRPLKDDEGVVQIESQLPLSAEVAITAGTTTGRRSTTIHYRYGEREALSRIDFDVQAPVVAEPNALAVTLTNSEETAEPVERTIRFHAASGGGCEIADVRCEPPEWLIDWKPSQETEASRDDASDEPGTSGASVTVRLQPIPDSVAARGTLSITSMVDAEEHVVTVPVSVLKLPKTE